MLNLVPDEDLRKELRRRNIIKRIQSSAQAAEQTYTKMGLIIDKTFSVNFNTLSEEQLVELEKEITELQQGD